LCQQSKADRKAEIRERRRRSIVTADTFALVAKNREAARVPFFAHPLQCFGIGFQDNLSLDLQILRHDPSG
jgi:hypothetical protein